MFEGNCLVRAAFARNMDLAMQLAWPAPGERWLDLGCGPGNLFASLHAAGVQILGVDLHDPFLEAARSVLNSLDPDGLRDHRILRSDVRELRDVPDASIDGVVSLETLEHVVPVERALDEVDRVLKPGGRFVYSVPVEVGLALPMKEAARRVLNFPSHGRYTGTELLTMSTRGGEEFQQQRLRLGGRVTDERGHATHLFFDHHVLERQVRRMFIVERATFSPVPVPGPWNLSRVVACRKGDN